MMKRKYADYPNWEKVLKKEYKNRYFNNDDFKGNISLLTAVKVKEKIISSDDNVLLLDDGFKWLEFYPETNKNIAVSVCINNKNEFLDWFFDIAKDSALTKDGIPYIDDLYLDLIMTPTGDIRMVDQEELQEALDKKIITQEDFDLAYEVANKLINQLDGKINKVIEFTKKYFDLIISDTLKPDIKCRTDKDNIIT